MTNQELYTLLDPIIERHGIEAIGLAEIPENHPTFAAISVLSFFMIALTESNAGNSERLVRMMMMVGVAIGVVHVVPESSGRCDN